MKLTTKKLLPGLAIALSLLIGAAATYGIVYADFRAHHQPVHFHANFAMYISGQRVDLSADKYMEDVGSCTVTGTQQTPRERVHLHNNVADAVHVHAAGVTWGDFLTNIGFHVDNQRLINDQGTTFQTGNGNKMSFILNGKAINDPTNLLIKDEDRLLISYGTSSDSAATMAQYLSIPNTAHGLDVGKDPATCAGNAQAPWTFFFWR
jgi:hypothetical protein